MKGVDHKKSIFTQRNGVGTSVRNLKGKRCTVAKMCCLVQRAIFIVGDKIITPQARFCWTLSHIVHNCFLCYLVGKTLRPSVEWGRDILPYEGGGGGGGGGDSLPYS